LDEKLHLKFLGNLNFDWCGDMQGKNMLSISHAYSKGTTEIPKAQQQPSGDREGACGSSSNQNENMPFIKHRTAFGPVTLCNSRL